MDPNPASPAFNDSDLSLDLPDDDFQQQLETVLETAEACLEKVVEQCGILRAQAEKSQETISDTMQRYTQLETQMASVRTELEKKKEALSQANRANKNFHQAQHKNQKKMADFQQKITNLEQTISEMQAQFQILKRDHVELQKAHKGLQKEHSQLQDAQEADSRENRVFLELAKKSIAAPAGEGAASDVAGKILQIEHHIEDLRNQIEEGNDEIDALVDKNDKLRAARREKYKLYKRMVSAEGEDVARLAKEFGEAMERNNTSSEGSVQED